MNLLALGKFICNMRVILDYTLIRAEWYFNRYHKNIHVDGNLILGCKIYYIKTLAKDPRYEKYWMIHAMRNLHYNLLCYTYSCRCNCSMYSIWRLSNIPLIVDGWPSNSKIKKTVKMINTHVSTLQILFLL